MTIGEEADERVRLREEIPAIDASDKKSRLLPLSMLSAPGLQSGLLASSEVRLDWSSRISLGHATTSPQPWPRPTHKWRTWTIG